MGWKTGTWAWIAAAFVASGALVACGGGGGTGGSGADGQGNSADGTVLPPGGGDAGVSDATGANGDGDASAPAPAGSRPGDGCPGLQRAQAGGSCAPISVGSAQCSADKVPSCADYKANQTCLAPGDVFPPGLSDLEAIYVDDDYKGATGQDGSRKRPFGTIAEALDAMTDTTQALVLAPGTYDHRIAIVGRPGFQLLGAGKCQGEAAKISVASSADYAVHIEDSPGAVVRGLTIEGGKTPLELAGDVHDSTIERTVIAGASADAVSIAGTGADGTVLRQLHIRAPVAAGCAVRLKSTTGITLDRISIDNPAGPGVCASQSGALTLRNLTVRKPIVAAFLLEDSEATVEATSVREGNGGGGIAVLGEASDVTVRDCLIDAPVDFGIYAGAGAHLDVDGCYVGGTTGEAPSTGYGIVVTGAQAVLRHVLIRDSANAAIAAFGAVDSIPPDAPPTDASAATLLVADARVEQSVVAGVYLRGVIGVMLDSLEVDGVERAGLDSSDIAAGVAGIWSSAAVSRTAVRGAADYGAIWTESKAVVRELSAEDSAAILACSEPLCANLDAGDLGAPTTGADRVPDVLAPPSEPGF